MSDTTANIRKCLCDILQLGSTAHIAATNTNHLLVVSLSKSDRVCINCPHLLVVQGASQEEARLRV